VGTVMGRPFRDTGASPTGSMDDAVIVGTKPGTARPHIRALEIDAVTCIATEQVQPPRRHAYAGALARVGTPKLDGFRLCDDGGSLPENLGRAL
jgi:hypothetical protein